MGGKLADGRSGQYPTLHTDLDGTRWRFDESIRKPCQQVHGDISRLYMLARFSPVDSLGGMFKAIFQWRRQPEQMVVPDPPQSPVMNNASRVSCRPQRRGASCAREGGFEEAQPGGIKEITVPPPKLLALSEIADGQPQQDELID
jgi:hypothetical protein